MKPARRHATYDDIVSAPELLVAELIDGDLYTSPRPAIPHARSASALGQDLRSFDRPPGDLTAPELTSGAVGHRSTAAEPPRARGRIEKAPGGWWILDEPELHFDADVLVPDLAGWRRERLPALPDEAAFTLAPDWACEVLSPSTAALDRTRKMPVYARAGVAWLWLIDPRLQTLEVYRLASGHWVVADNHGGSRSVRAEPFAEVELDMRRWWGEV